MKKTIATAGLTVALIAPVGAATAAPTQQTAPTGGWVSVETARSGALGGIAKHWEPSFKRKVCTAFDYKPRKASNIVARNLIKEGWYPKRNVKRGVRQALRLAC